MKGETNMFKMMVYILIFVVVFGFALSTPLIDGVQKSITLFGIIAAFLIFFIYTLTER